MPVFRGITRVSVNNGLSTLFWKDNWNNAVYAEKFPQAFSFASTEDVSVQTFLGTSSLQEAFSLPLSEQAYDELRMIQQEIREVQLNPRGDDWVCSWGASTFETAAYRRFCFQETTVHPAFRWLWKTKCVPKIKVFGWFLLMDRLNTRNMLKRRHYNIGTNLDCMLCDRRVEETLEHLFFECSFSQRCWNMLNITWSERQHRLEKLQHQRAAHPRDMFMDVFLVAAWSIWKERNNKCFEQIIPSLGAWWRRFVKGFSNLRHRVPTSKVQNIDSVVATLADTT